MKGWFIKNPFWEMGEVKSKECLYCKTKKPLSHFAKHSGHFDGHDGRCKVCCRKRVKEVKKIRRTAPPITTTCQCCGKQTKYQNDHYKPTKLCLDHNPLTKKFRGWLCKECNMAIGLLGDDLKGVQNAIDYLKNRL